jgi:hypothetical protein
MAAEHKPRDLTEARSKLLSACAHSRAAEAAASEALEVLNRSTGTDQLAVAVRALRAIANSDPRTFRFAELVRGIATGALAEIGARVKK